MAEKEYIERGALIDKIFPIGLIDDGRYVIPAKAVKTAIDKAPTADVAPVVHAEWKDNHCTVCGMMPMGEELWDSCDNDPPKFEFFMDFCPNCGARMDGEAHDSGQ